MRNKLIEIKDLHKTFKLPNERSSGIKQSVINFFKGVKGYTEQEVLDGVSFDVQKGDFLGIVGRNGSGKSTLLKLLVGVYAPTSGSVRAFGGVTPFIELGVGFNPELTGRENIYLNGALLGFSTEEMEKRYAEIVDFSELHDFMDQKLKNYSSGMQVRLAFSIAIHAKNDILIFDEVLAVGDEAFKKKCQVVFEGYKETGQTVILVTHSMSDILRYCSRAIVLDGGKILFEGDTKKAADIYHKLNS
jgi:ABC-2 type transport system ATP-binding protein